MSDRFLVMLSPKKGPKKATQVICEGVGWEALGLYERRPNEPVHLREDANEPCHVCDFMGGVWVENASSYQTHRARCSEMDDV